MGWLISLTLCLAGLGAIIIEFFVPAAGVIGVLGVGSIIGGIVLAYVGYGSGVGAAFLIGAVVATPGVIALYFKLFPKSFVGRWLILRAEQKTDDGFTAYESKSYDGLTGAEGIALTVLRPSGMAQLDGAKHSVVTAGDYIEKRERIRVIRVEGSRIIVGKGEQK